MMLALGERAPDFTLTGTQGSFQLSQWQGQKNVILIFYPKDNTSGWVKQLSAARDAVGDLSQYDTIVVGVNPGSMKSHSNFAEKYEFNFPLLVDEERKVAQAYDVLKENGTSIQRTVYIVDKKGYIQYAAEGNPATEELTGVLERMNYVE